MILTHSDWSGIVTARRTNYLFLQQELGAVDGLRFLVPELPTGVCPWVSAFLRRKAGCVPPCGGKAFLRLPGKVCDASDCQRRRFQRRSICTVTLCSFQSTRILRSAI